MSRPFLERASLALLAGAGIAGFAWAHDTPPGWALVLVVAASPILGWRRVPAFLVGFLTGKDEIVIERQRRSWLGLVTTYPVRYPLTAVNSLLPLLTSLFLHGGLWHLLGNMWFLWIFGDNVEDRLGHLRFLLFYVGGGVAASLVHVLVSVAFSGPSLIPTIGASGAVSAVLGAYLLAFPTARIVTFLPIFFFIYLVEIPASIYLLFWFVFQQVLPGLGSLGTAGGGVAFWAHIGGFLAGMGYLYATAPGAPRGPGRYLPLQRIG